MVCSNLSAAALSVQGCVTKDMTASKSQFERLQSFLVMLFISSISRTAMCTIITLLLVFFQTEKDFPHSIL